MTITSNVTGLKPGVCLSTNRPTTPYTGQVIYETDTGYLRVWNGSAWDYLSLKQSYAQGLGAGQVIQAVHQAYSTATSNTTTTYASTGVSASITPSSSSNKILVMLNQAGCGKSAGNGSIQIQLTRNGSQVATQNGAYTNAAGYNIIGSMSIIYFDSPATTSSVSYASNFRGDAAGMTVLVQDSSSHSSITLLEIVA